MQHVKTVLSPLYDRLLVRKKEAEDVSKGGIIIPDSAKEPLNQGVIVAAGNGKMLEDGRMVPLTVKVGDVVMFGRFAGTDIKVDLVPLLMIREDEILAIVTEVTEDDGVVDAEVPEGEPV